MLSYLHVRGLALLEDVALDLSPGMTVLTGETGAGKSIIVDALMLLRGGKGRVELIRAGAEAASVEGQFELTEPLAARVRGILEERGLPPLEEDSVVLQRHVPRSGRGRSLVQAGLTTQAGFAAIGEQLVDICSQHEHHSLTQVSRHLELLDGFARLDAEVARYRDSYRALREAQQELANLRESAANALSRADYLRFQLDELERIAPQPGELERLEREINLMRSAQRWASFAEEAVDVLYEGDGAISVRLGRLREQSSRGASDSEHLAAMADQLSHAMLACEEALGHARELLAHLEFEPRALEQAEERLHELNAVRRKHGASIEELSERATQMRAELDTLEHASERTAELEARVDKLLAAALEVAEVLHARRLEASSALARALEGELAALHIPRARLEVKVERLPASDLGPRGLDRVEFLFSANPGEPTAPLTRVASGGELSRVLLALKGVLSTGDTVATYVFDEVDSGVGGAVAEAIGQRLARASTGTQVLCITHLPQIAAFANTHLRVEKLTEGGRTITRVTRLDDEERREELARMLGGSKVTRSAREHAQQLLGEAARTRAEKPPARKAQRAR